MARFLKKRDNTAGLSPGTMVFVGQRKIDKPRLRVLDFDEATLRDEFVQAPKALAECRTSPTTTWFNVDGLHDADIMASVAATFRIPSLIMEDIVNTGHRPKLEEALDELFVTLKMLSWNEAEGQIESEQLSAVLTGRCLITFQERPGDIFDPVRERLKRPGGRLRRLGPDYLLYSLLDCVFENYLKVVELLGERIEDLEDEVLDNPTQELLEEVNSYRREMAYVRKAVRPAREIVIKLMRTENGLISDDLMPYIRDLMDLAEQISDAVDIYREMLTDHLNSYNMAVNNRLNDVMKFLTIFASIFIPLSFLAGVYGMNFEFMPELKAHYGYYILLGFMGSVAGGMLLYFKKRKWI